MHRLIIFSGQIPHFCKFCRALVCLGATCSFFSISSCNILLLFVLRAFYIRTFDYHNCFSGVSEVLFVFFCGCIFAVKNNVLHRFALARFAFFVYFFTIVCNCAVGICISSLLQSLIAQNYPYYTLYPTFLSAQS